MRYIKLFESWDGTDFIRMAHKLKGEKLYNMGKGFYHFIIEETNDEMIDKLSEIGDDEATYLRTIKDNLQCANILFGDNSIQSDMANRYRKGLKDNFTTISHKDIDNNPLGYIPSLEREYRVFTDMLVYTIEHLDDPKVMDGDGIIEKMVRRIYKGL